MGNSKTIGDTSEAMIIASISKFGIPVAIPLGENQRYDLIADDVGELLKIQCKTGKYKDGLLNFNTKTVFKGKNNVIISKPYSKKEIDFIMVYSPQLDKIYIIPIEKATKGSMSLRIDPPKCKVTNKPIRWAKDYEFKGKFN